MFVFPLVLYQTMRSVALCLFRRVVLQIFLPIMAAAAASSNNKEETSQANVIVSASSNAPHKLDWMLVVVLQKQLRFIGNPSGSCFINLFLVLFLLFVATG
jgi:hypothetical protein